jgi:uncharacterized protein YbjT (DUF2867 family)
MGTTHGFEETDRQAAENFAAAACAQGIQRIIYLGGLGSRIVKLSPHLRSRQEVGEILRQSGIPAIFDPAGLQRLLYWYSFYLFHQFVFSGMLRGIGRAARNNVEKP